VSTTKLWARARMSEFRARRAAVADISGKK
jgi:hypothetical protein